MKKPSPARPDAESRAFQYEADAFREQGGLLRMSEALDRGITRYALRTMESSGLVERLSRGVYRLVEGAGLEHPDLTAVAARVPRAVICLISALAFHELTTRIPHAVDIALPRDATTTPRIDYPPVQVYRFSGLAYSEGLEAHVFGGVEVKVYSKEKSIADAFKYRNKIGLDVALEALKGWCGTRGRNIDTLLAMARVCRVHNVMRPYLEALA